MALAASGRLGKLDQEVLSAEIERGLKAQGARRPKSPLAA
jgi:hypothetical protein